MRSAAGRYDDREMRGPRSWADWPAGPGRDPRHAWRAAGPPRDNGPSGGAADRGWQPEEWIDEGELRDEAGGRSGAAAVGGGRAGTAEPPRARRAAQDLEAPGPAAGPTAADDEVRRAVAPNRMAPFERQMQDAGDAFRLGRYEDARRFLRPLAERAPKASSVTRAVRPHPLPARPLGPGRPGLEAFRTQTGATEQHPVLADCYRALEALRRGRGAIGGATRRQPGGRGGRRGTHRGRRAPSPTRAASRRPSTCCRRQQADKQAQLHHLRIAYALADLYERGRRPAPRPRAVRPRPPTRLRGRPGPAPGPLR